MIERQAHLGKISVTQNKKDLLWISQKKATIPAEKWAKDRNKNFIEKKIWMAPKQTKKRAYTDWN